MNRLLGFTAIPRAWRLTQTRGVCPSQLECLVLLPRNKAMRHHVIAMSTPFFVPFRLTNAMHALDFTWLSPPFVHFTLPLNLENACLYLPSPVANCIIHSHLPFNHLSNFEDTHLPTLGKNIVKAAVSSTLIFLFIALVKHVRQ